MDSFKGWKIVYGEKKRWLCRWKDLKKSFLIAVEKLAPPLATAINFFFRTSVVQTQPSFRK